MGYAATSTEVTRRTETVEVNLPLPHRVFPDQGDGVVTLPVFANINSDHIAQLFLDAVIPIIGTNAVTVKLNRNLAPGSDPVYPDGSGTLYAEISILVMDREIT